MSILSQPGVHQALCGLWFTFWCTGYKGNNFPCAHVLIKGHRHLYNLTLKEFKDNQRYDNLQRKLARPLKEKNTSECRC